jgi:hypothetical protein
MVQPMTSFHRRRALGAISVAVILGLYWVLEDTLANNLRRPALVSGWVLFGVLGLLTFFNARKKLPFLPLFKASTWLQFHIYAGLFAVGLCWVHMGFRLPRGALGIVLTGLFLAVSVSGVVGLALSRWLPSRLTVSGENLIFERIPALRVAIKQEVEKVVLGSVPAARSTTIADFYEQRLRTYFEQPRHLWSHWLGYSKPLHGLLSEIAALDRYLDAEERSVMAQITEHVREKDNLDFQWAAQGLLKGWLFVHVPLTFALLLVALGHGVLAWNFS